MDGGVRVESGGCFAELRSPRINHSKFDANHYYEMLSIFLYQILIPDKTNNITLQMTIFLIINKIQNIIISAYVH